MGGMQIYAERSMHLESIHNPARLRSLAELGLFEHPDHPAFDRLAALTARLLRAPVALISLVGDTSQHLSGAVGLDEPWASLRETPLSHSFCQYVVSSGQPLVVANAPEHPLVCGNPAIVDLHVIAYAGVPLRSSDGQIVGSLCAIDTSPRAWGEDDIAMLRDLALTAETELSLRREVRLRARAGLFQDVQRSTFEQIVAGVPLNALLSTLAQGIEGQIDGGRCAVMLLVGRHLRTAAAPSLPPAYSAVIDNAEIGPKAGSCGTAAYLGQPVVVTDIASDPLWEDWRDLALGYGLRACWSVPVFDSAGATLGTFALYHDVIRRPSPGELDLVQGAANIVAVAVDRWRTIDALRASEARLRQSEANLAAVFDHTEEAIWSLDSACRVVTLNPQAAATLGEFLGCEIVVGTVLGDVMGAEQYAFWHALYLRAMSGEKVAIEYPYAHAGAERWAEVVLNPLRIEGLVCGVSVFSSDLTSRKRAEAEQLELERAWQEAQRLESLGVLAGGIAHDFNNLLVTILGNTELAMQDLADPELARESLEQVELAARRAAEMTSQILAYAGKGRFMLAPIDLNSLVSETVGLLRGALLQPVTIRCALAAGLPPLSGDASQLRQVVMNLIINAAEAIGDGPGEIQIVTSVLDLDGWDDSLSPPPAPGRYICLVVRDGGPGMDASTLERIFEPFFTTKFVGRGLGLAAVQGIVRGHAGALRVESAPGAGTQFSVVLPAGAASPQGLGAAG
jgi:PAS domain S-box-containing protein